jgi:zinc D-Ala-D-Ala carboxypeptidase
MEQGTATGQMSIQTRPNDVAGRLSEHFTLIELVRSEYAARNGIDNTPTAEVIIQLQLLCRELLEPVRLLFGGSPVVVTSGFRCPVLNAGIGGKNSSQHQIGQAADFHVLGFGIKETVVKIMNSEIKFDQLIYEFGESGWVHISRSDQPRRKVLTAYRNTEGKTVYINFT